MYYRTCPDCGANLDPDERCDCGNKEEAALLAQMRPQAIYQPTDILADFGCKVKTDDRKCYA